MLKIHLKMLFNIALSLASTSYLNYQVNIVIEQNVQSMFVPVLYLLLMC